MILFIQFKLYKNINFYFENINFYIENIKVTKIYIFNITF